MNILCGSKIIHLIKYILSAIYCGLTDSLIAKLLGFISRAFMSSFIYKAVISLMNGISAVFKGSSLYKMLYRKDSLSIYMDNSLFYRFTDRSIKSILDFFAGIYNKIRNLNNGSINNRLYNSIRTTFGLSYENILGIVLILIVLVPGSIWNNLYGLLAAVFLLGLYFICAISGREFSISLKEIGVSMLIFAVCLVVSLLSSLDRSDSLRVLMFFITSFIFMFVISGSMNTEEKLDKLIGFIYLGVILTSFICIYQGIVGIETDMQFVDTNTSGKIQRMVSTFENPNNYAEYLVLFMPFMAAFALNRKTNKEKFGYMALLVFPVAALLMTYSRSCWITFAISAVLFLLLYDYKLFPYFAVLVLFAIPFVPESIWTRILSIGNLKDTSNFFRVEIWRGCLNMIKDCWLTGTGLGPLAFRKLYLVYAVPYAITAPHSHLLFLEILLEIGVVGAITFFIWWFFSIKRFFTALIRENLKGRKLRNIIIASVSSLVGITFVSCVEYIWFYPRVMVMFFAAAGIMMAAMKILRKD